MLKITIVLHCLLAVILLGCNGKSDPESITSDPHSRIDHNASHRIMIPDSVIRTENIRVQADTILGHLKNKEFNKLAKYIHPEKGVRLVPYSYIDTARHQRFSRTEFKAIDPENDYFLWGNYDGTGDSIYLTLEGYHSEFLYSQPFENADSVSVNKRLGKGNTINNIKMVYPDARFIEYHFQGFDKRYQGMDWASLRLVFEKYVDRWYLVALIHDQWTI